MKKRIVSLIVVLALAAGFMCLAPTAFAEGEKPLGLGRIEDNVYTNEYMGLGFSFDDSWLVYSAEELQQLYGTVIEVIGDTDISELIEGRGQIYDMMAENADELLSINVIIGEVPANERLYYALNSEETIIDNMLESKDMLIEAYQQGGISVNSMEKVKMYFLGKERFGVYTDACINGEIPYYILQFFDYSFGGYCSTVTMCSYLEDRTAELSRMWFALE